MRLTLKLGPPLYTVDIHINLDIEKGKVMNRPSLWIHFLFAPKNVLPKVIDFIHLHGNDLGSYLNVSFLICLDIDFMYVLFC